MHVDWRVIGKMDMSDGAVMIAFERVEWIDIATEPPPAERGLMHFQVPDVDEAAQFEVGKTYRWSVG